MIDYNLTSVTSSSGIFTTFKVKSNNFFLAVIYQMDGLRDTKGYQKMAYGQTRLAEEERSASAAHRQTGRQADRHRHKYRLADRQKQTHTQTKRHKQADRQTDTDTQTQT